MHYTQKRQRNRAFLITITILLFIIGGVSYSLVSVYDLTRKQNNDYEEMQNKINALSKNLDHETQLIKEEYAQKIERMETFIVQREEEYNLRTQNLIKLVEETEKNNDIKLGELKEELSNLNSGDFSEIIGEVLKSAVSIDNGASTGSGVVISSQGHIVTNAHVIKEMENVVIIDHTGNEIEANLLVKDTVRDLAILKATGIFKEHLELADSEKVVVGERVIAIGSPEGLELTVTQGIISASNRVFDEEEGAFIQTDVPINSGSSGGGLINSEGELIGINTFKIKGSESLGFAIPSNDVKKLLESI